MSPTQAILSGALIIAATIAMFSGSRPATASMTGAYQLMHHSNSTAVAGVFRMDTSNGEISYCYVVEQRNGQTEVTCSRPAK